MGREFPASSLERGDEEGRTWDEMVDWERPPFSSYDGAYDYADEEDVPAGWASADPTNGDV